MDGDARLHRIGAVLAAVQFFFALSWTVYVVYLPQLAVKAGLPASAVPLILLADQAIFAVMDFIVGVAADRVARVMGRLARLVLVTTLASCLAFLLLPYLAPSGSGVLLALIAVWAVTSSALRAPPLVLLGRYVPAPRQPWLASLSLLGLGIAAAVAPYLAVTLRNVDPRWPFVLVSVALACATLGIVWVEKRLAHVDMPVQREATASPPSSHGVGAFFLVAIALLALGYQIHFSLNSTPQYARFAAPAALVYLMPVFWIGFNLCMLPASLLTRRHGGVAVMAVSSVVGAIALWATSTASELRWLLVAQFVAGGAWGCVLMSAVSAALRVSRVGALTGALFALLAVAAMLRIAATAAGVAKDPHYVPLLDVAPMLGWALAAALLVVVAARVRGT